jgi:hypothetical protein
MRFLNVHTVLAFLVAGSADPALLTTSVLADDQPTKQLDALRKSLTFYASFDKGMDADFAKGDRRIHSAPTLDERKTGKPGAADNDAVSLAPNAGRFGGALRFQRQTPAVVYYRVEQNLGYSPSNWSGTISFWLKLDPDKDLPPGFCDPLFITPRTFNDGALWVDFSDKPPRQFRHGAFPDRNIWDPQLRDFDQTPEAERPLVTVKKPSFSRDHWTHIAITFEHFNTGQPNGSSTLYLNGEPAGRIGPREQTFTWEVSASTAVLGINYVGLFDELAFFDRRLSRDEVKALFELSCGLAAP